MVVTKKPSQMTTQTPKGPECSVASTATKDDYAVACFHTIQRVGSFNQLGVIAEGVELSRPIATSSAGRQKAPKADLRQVNAQSINVGDEIVEMEDQTLDVESLSIERRISEFEQMMGASSMGVAQQLSSLSAGFGTAVAYQMHADVRFEKGFSSPDSTPADPKDITFLEPTDGMAPELSSQRNTDFISRLQLWLYQNSNDRMTTAERLEKSKWEKRPLERL